MAASATNPDDEDGVERHAAEHQAIQRSTTLVPHAETVSTWRHTRRANGIGRAAGRRQLRVFDEREDQQRSATARKISGGANQTTATATATRTAPLRTRVT